MRNSNISRMLRYHRKLKQLTVKDVSGMLKDYGVVAAPKTIYAWENGTTQPSADTLMLLCELYEIEDILETFGYTGSRTSSDNEQYTNEEKELIEHYRMHPEMHTAVRQLLNMNHSD